MMNVQLIGEQAARARIRAVGTSLGAAVAPANAAGAQIVEADAKDRAAVLTGEMRDSIHTEGGEVATDNDHAFFNEFGTSVMAAQPFIRPALDENEAQVEAAMAAIYRAALSIFG